jgi:hypothetical protein
MQFNLQCQMLGSLHNLDFIEKTRQSWMKNNTGPVIDSPAALDNAMFGSLRFTEHDKYSISR